MGLLTDLLGDGNATTRAVTLEQFGAAGDALHIEAGLTTTSGSATLTANRDVFTADMVTRLIANSANFPPLGHAGTLIDAVSNNPVGFYVAGVTGALPATFGTPTTLDQNHNAPIVVARAA